MNKTLHVALKFPNDTSITVAGKKTNTIIEHQQLCSKENRLIWGQGSDRTSSGIALKNRDRIKSQIRDDVNTYTFFVANNSGSKELYVGKMINVYDRGEIPKISPLIRFIPSYYATDVGTRRDINILFVDVISFIRIDDKYLNAITLESNNKKVTDIKNASSIFLVNISTDLDNYLNAIFSNSENNYQKQVEQEYVPSDIHIEDLPKPKPSTVNLNGRSTYQRDAKTSKTAIVAAKYLCEIDPGHKDFISKTTGENYVEAHHLIPMEYENQFDNSIDVEANIVSLCCSCHKKLHHADYSIIKHLIDELYEARKKRLDDCEILITKQQLLNYYK